MLLIYDGDCGFCTTTANWYARKAGGSARIAAWQSLDLDSIGLTSEQTMTSVWFVDRDGSKSSGADACAAALSNATYPWRVFGRLLAMPGVINVARSVYPLIARNRHRLPGATASCAVNQPPAAGATAQTAERSRR